MRRLLLLLILFSAFLSLAARPVAAEIAPDDSVALPIYVQVGKVKYKGDSIPT